MLFVPERSGSLPNKSLVRLMTWSSATFLNVFFLSKLLLARVVMVVLSKGLVNHSDVLIHLDTNTSL